MTVHRDAAELYRRRVQEVATLFADRALAPKVNDLLREVVEAIVVTPGAGKTWRVEVRGSLPGLFRWGRSPTPAALLSGRDRGDLFSSVQLVAGARYRLDRSWRFTPTRSPSGSRRDVARAA
jgi:hypothetical protein